MIRPILLSCLFSLVPMVGIPADSAPPPFGSADDPVRLRDPEYRHAWLQLKRREYAEKYIDVGRALQLSPTMVGRLLDLLVAQQLAGVEQLIRMPANARQAETFSRATQAMLASHEKQIGRLLGPGKMGAWRDYQEGLSWRQSVERLRKRIGPGPDALRDDQVESLIAIMRQANSEMMQPTERPADAPDPQKMTPQARRDYFFEQAHTRIDARDERVYELATPYLTPPQLTALVDWLWDQNSHAATARPFRATRKPQ